jgi:GNAT superfamily N-acetyltransferase
VTDAAGAADTTGAAATGAAATGAAATGLEIALRAVGLDHPQARALERRHIAEMGQRYGGSGPGPVRGDEFDPPGGCFVVALFDGCAVACGGFRRLDPRTAEIKRMYVDTAFRRRGIGRRLLVCLEERVAAAGYGEIWLETGIEQPEAISLYTSRGYRPTAPYGEFMHDPRNRSYRRVLDEHRGSTTGP